MPLGFLRMAIYGGHSLALSLAGFLPLVSLAFPPSLQEPEKGNRGSVEGAKGKSKLPTHFSKIGLSADQIKSILEIQAKYQAEMKELTEKLAVAKSSMKKELLGILGPDQIARLEDLQKSAKSKDKD